MGVALILSAIPILTMGGILLAFMLVKLLHHYVLPDHEWARFAIMGGVLAPLGGTLVFGGLKQLNRIRSMLPQTMKPLNPQAPMGDDGVSASRPRTDALLKR